MDMPLPQLGAIKQQLDQVSPHCPLCPFHWSHPFVLQEVEVLSRSVQQLTSARAKFQESSDCITRQSSVEDDASILVPLTGSIYVSGAVVNKNKFLIDIGTGYFVEKDTNTAVDFFTRKVTFINTQIEKYIRLLQEKSFLRESEYLAIGQNVIALMLLISGASGVMEVVQVKQQQMMASTAAVPASSAAS